MRDLAGSPVGRPCRRDNRQRLQKQTGKKLVFTRHCWIRMAERNADRIDVLHSLKYGKISDSYWDTKYQNQKYRVEGIDTEGVSLTVIVAMDERLQTAHLVTVF